MKSYIVQIGTYRQSNNTCIPDNEINWNIKAENTKQAIQKANKKAENENKGIWTILDCYIK